MTTPNDPPVVEPVVTDPPAAAVPAASAFADPVTPPVEVPLAERIPEKYRVTKDDGTLDLEASTAKLTDAYGNLEKKLGTGDVAPKDADGYDPKVEAFDMEALKADPEYQKFLKGAHLKGLTNAQVEFVLEQYGTRQSSEAPNPLGMSTEDFKAAVEPAFAEYGGYQKGMAQAVRTIRTFAPDVTAEDLASLPHNPLIAKVLAAVGKELPEDTGTPRVGALSASDFDTEVAAIRASEAYNQANHPQHKEAIAKMDALYARRYGTAPQKLGAGAVVIHN